MNTKCEVDVILKIALLQFDWECVGRRLLPLQIVIDIKRSDPDEASRREKMLTTWLQRDGTKATYAHLVEVLKEVHFTDTAEEVTKLVTGKGERWGKGVIKRSAYFVVG